MEIQIKSGINLSDFVKVPFLCYKKSKLRAGINKVDRSILAESKTILIFNFGLEVR